MNPLFDASQKREPPPGALANRQVLQLFLEYAPAAIALFDREMRYIAVSHRYLTDYRLTEQNIVGRAHYDIFPEIPDRWKEIHQRCLAGATEKAEEDPFPREDGTLDWVRWEIRPWYETPEKIGGILLFSEVITERVEAKQALQEREQKLHQVLEMLPIGVSILNANREVVFQNTTLTEILDIMPDELSQGAFQKRRYLAADGGVMALEQFASVQATQSGQAVHNVETGIVKENGETIWTRVSAVPIDFPDWKTVVVTADITQQKRAEQSLYESKQSIEAIFNAATDSIFLMEADGTVLTCNPVTAARLGKRVEDLVGANIHDFLPPEVARARLKQVEQVIQTRKPSHVENEWAGTWLENNIYPLIDEDGQIRRVAVYGRDITERKRADEQLRESEKRYRLISENADDVIWVMDPFARKFLYVSPSVEKLRGYTPEEVMAQPIEDSLTPESLKIVREGLAENLPSFIAKGEGTRSNVTEVDQPCKDGSIVHTEVTTTYLFNERGKVEILGVSRDITARKRAEEALRKSEELFRNTLEGMLEGVQIIGFDWRYIYLNATAAIHNRRPNAELLGQRYLDMWPGIEETHVFTLLKNCMETRTAYHIENEFVFPDGLVQWYELSIQPVPEGIFILSINITERKRAEAERRKLIERLDLATSAAHMGIWDWNIQQNELVWDEQMYALYGLQQGEFGGAYEAWKQGVHPEDRVASDEISAQARRGERLYDTEFRVVWPDGSVHWLKANGEVYWDHAGTPIRMIGVNYDITEQKNAEATLRESEARFRALFENALEAILMSQPDGRILAVNPAAQKLFGLSEQNFLATDRQTIMDENDARIPHLLQERQETGRMHGELTFIRGDGTKFEGEVTSAIYLDKDEQPKTNLVVRDVTARKRMENALRTANRRFQMILESLYGGILVLNHENYAEFANQAFCELFDLNLSPEALLGLHARDILPIIQDRYADPPQALARINEIVANMQPLQDEEIPMSGGRTYLRDFIPLEIDGQAYGRLWHHLDITERKHLEDQLRLNEERLQLALRPSYMVLSQTDTDARYTWIYNPHPDFDPGTVIGKTDVELADNEGSRKLYAAKCQVIQTGQGQQTEIAFPVSDGLRSYDFIIEPRRNASGQVIGVTTSAYDITERRRIEDDLRRSNAELEQFAYVASHDLQEPLRAVAGMVQLLQQRYQGQLDARADEYIRHAVDAANRMRTLINDLLDYSRVERRGQPFAPVALTQVLEVAMHNLDVSIQETEARITWDPLPTINADGAQLIQLFQNLIGNSIKFRGAHPPHIHIHAEPAPGGWHFTVRDNGIGIDAQYFARIFLLFQRLHTRSEFPGTGIGLALCKKIVERHKGQIWVESQINEGATFHFTLSSEAFS